MKNDAVFQMLSEYGKQVSFLKSGVLSQTWEAREKAFAFNATLGEARTQGGPMYLHALADIFGGQGPESYFPYTQPGGLPELRALWQERVLKENLEMPPESLSMPVTVAGMTHGLSLIGELFLDPGDPVILHDKHWENYELIFGTRCGGKIHTYPTFRNDRFNVEGLKRTVAAVPGDKALVVLNFPNNPTGYMPDQQTAAQIVQALKELAASGKKLTVLCDDAYFGFFYDPGCARESLFGQLTGCHPNLLAVRLDGATKSYFAGGFRLGFLTYGGQAPEDLAELERKTIGAVRISVSSCSRFAQIALLRCLTDPEIAGELEGYHQQINARGLLAMALCAKGSEKGLWKAYPFGAGYFFCIHVQADSEALRQHLLNKYGIGIISLGNGDIRAALLCMEESQIRQLFQILDLAISEIM